MLVGTSDRAVDVDQIRRTARHSGADVLIGLQGNRLVLVLGRVQPDAKDPQASAEPLPFIDIANRLGTHFAAGPLVLGPTVEGEEWRRRRALALPWPVSQWRARGVVRPGRSPQTICCPSARSRATGSRDAA